jgi:hypothetical protein
MLHDNVQKKRRHSKHNFQWIVACLHQIEVSEAVESIAIHVNDMTIHEKDVTLVSFNGDMIQVKDHV